MEQSRCYLLSSDQSTWDLAKQDCLNRGAHLVTVDSHDKQQTDPMYSACEALNHWLCEKPPVDNVTRVTM
ncbi:hypothetical protein CRUP_018257 [Coryphaenoides rupestris]|nr:hypothetical protein CRUP_018257 [Coryphaenoides rupestris]